MRFSGSRTAFIKYLPVVAICLVLASCTLSITPGSGTTFQCQGNCAVGSGVQLARVFVEPDDDEQAITSAIRSAHKSIWLGIYIPTDRNVIRAPAEAANNGLELRVMPQ